jgi:hypothetical protein
MVSQTPRQRWDGLQSDAGRALVIFWEIEILVAGKEKLKKWTSLWSVEWLEALKIGFVAERDREENK